jgi:hypothetical protein
MTSSSTTTAACETCRGGRGGGATAPAAALRAPRDEVLVRGGNGGGLPVLSDMFSARRSNLGYDEVDIEV